MPLIILVGFFQVSESQIFHSLMQLFKLKFKMEKSSKANWILTTETPDSGFSLMSFMHICKCFGMGEVMRDDQPFSVELI